MAKNKIITINDDYRIEVDENNFTLQKHKTEKQDFITKEMAPCDIWLNIGYYGNVYNALRRIINDVEIKPYEDISALVERMKEMFEELKEVASRYE